MAGGHGGGAEIAGGGEEVGELDGLVAGDAGDRRLAPRVALGERLDHRLAEARLVVEHVMRDAELRGDLARVVDVLPGAAGAGAMRGRAVVVELQGDADHIVAGRFTRAATTEESTPPDMATTTRVAARGPGSPRSISVMGSSPWLRSLQRQAANASKAAAKS